MPRTIDVTDGMSDEEAGRFTKPEGVTLPPKASAETRAGGGGCRFLFGMVSTLHSWKGS